MKRNLFVRFPGGRGKALTFSYDDGCLSDRRFVALLDRYNLKGTFNLNSDCFRKEGEIKNRRMTEAETLELFKNGPHEVAVHAATHPFLDTLPPATVTLEIIEDRRNLERLFGRVVRGSAYPFGTQVATDRVRNILPNCGIVYARTTESTGTFDLPRDWLRWPATCKHTDPRLMGLARDFIGKEVGNRAQLFYLWGHTFEFDDQDNWNVIEEFTAFVAGHEDAVWYATNIEIYDYLQAFERLECAADMSIVHNPSAQTVWFKFDGRDFSVGQGETITTV